MAKVTLVEEGRLRRSHTLVWYPAQLPRYNIWEKSIIHCTDAHGLVLQHMRSSSTFVGPLIVYTVQPRWVLFVRKCAVNIRHCCLHFLHFGPGISISKKGSYADQFESDLLELMW